MNTKTVLLTLAMSLAAGGVVRGAGASNHADVLKLLPADMPLVISIRSLADLDKSVAAIGKRLDPDSAPSSISEGITGELKIAEWVDFSKPIGLGQSGIGGSPDLYCVAIPDFVKKVKAMDRASETDGVWTIAPEEGQPGRQALYAILKGDYVLAATNKALVQRAAKAERTMADELKDRTGVFRDRNVFVHIDMKPLRDQTLSGLASASQMLPMVGMMLGPQAGGVDPATITKMLTVLVNTTTEFAEQVSYIDLAVDVSGTSIDATIATGYIDGPIKSYLASQTAATMPFLTEIPDQPYVVAMGVHLPGDKSPFLDYVFDEMTKAMTAPSPGADAGGEGEGKDGANEALIAAMEINKKLYGGITGTNFLLTFSDEGMLELGDVIAKDPPKTIGLLKEVMGVADSLLSHLGMSGMSYKATGSTKVGGVDVEGYSLTLDENDPATAKLASMYGKNSKMAFGVDKGRVRFCLGRDKDFQNYFGSKIGSPLSDSPHVKQVLAALPAKRNAVLVIDAARAFSSFGAMAGMPAGGPVPPGPAIGISVSMSQEPARVDIHVPVAAIERIVKAASPAEPM